MLRNLSVQTLGMWSCCYNPTRLCPSSIGPSFLEWSGLGPDCLGPSEHPSFCPTNLPRGICGIRHSFISSFWSQPRFYVFRSIRPLCSIFRTSLLFYFLCLTLMLFCSTLIVYYLYLLFSISSYTFKS